MVVVQKQGSGPARPAFSPRTAARSRGMSIAPIGLRMSSEPAPRERPNVPQRGHTQEKPRKSRRITAFGIGVSKTTASIVGGIAELILLLFFASFFVDEPMRRAMERSMNRRLKGYSVTLPKLHFQ